MLKRIINDPAVHEVIGRTLVNTVKLGIVAALFLALQKQFNDTSNVFIATMDQDITKLNEQCEA